MKEIKYVVGPIRSARLGISLGVDIVPFKRCSFDCIYCQLGPTVEKTSKRFRYGNIPDIKKEIQLFLKKNKKIDYITVLGRGEPTLNLNIGRIIGMIKKTTGIPIAVLTNGSLMTQKNVRRDLLAADLVMPTLDASNEKIFQMINRPDAGLSIQKIINAFRAFRKEFKGKLWLELMFVKGINDSRANIARLKKAIKEIMPDKVFVKTVTRPPHEKAAIKLSNGQLKIIEELLGEKPTPSFRKIIRAEYVGGLQEAIISIVSRHPATFKDIMATLKVTNASLKYALDELLKGEKIHATEYMDEAFYTATGHKL